MEHATKAISMKCEECHSKITNERYGCDGQRGRVNISHLVCFYCGSTMLKQIRPKGWEAEENE